MKKYKVSLSEIEREQLNQMIRRGKAAAQSLLHARILLKADSNDEQSNWRDEQIRAALDVSLRTISRVRERYVEEGLEAALARKAPTRVYRHKITGQEEAHLIALACSAPPEGRVRWTLQLLADKMVELCFVESVSYETVRQVLKKMNLNLG